MEKTYNLYQNILKELGLFSIVDHHAYYKFFVAPIQTLRRYITFNNKHLVNIILTNITNKNKDFTLSDIIFNPLNENLESCSMQFLNDEIHRYVSQIIYSKIIQNIIEKSNSNITVRKWQNILVVVRKKNLMNFSFSLKNQNKVYINFEYPLLNILKFTTNNLCGIQLEKDEIDSFIKTYEEVTNQIFEGLLKNPIIVPEKSNQHQYLYAFIKFYTTIKEATLTKSQISRLRKKQGYNFLIQEINNLNDFNSYKLSEELNKLDHESYIQELQIRKESESDLALLKDGIMKYKNKLVTQEEINTRFNKQYWNKYIEKISTLQSTRDIELKKLDYEQMIHRTELSEILEMQKLVLNIINGENGRFWFDTRTKKYSFRSESDGDIVSTDKKEMTTILNIAMQKNLPKHHLRDTDFLNHVIEVVLVESINDIAKHTLKDAYKTSQVTKVLIFISAIPTINGDVFDLDYTEEIFQSTTDLLYKRNRFIPTKHLYKRYLKNSGKKQWNQKKTFIEKFIYFLVKEDKELSDYIMNWLAYYFQNLKKSKSALVLMGDQEATQGILWNIIIHGIFGRRYCSTINDEYESRLVLDIAKDKLFFNIDDIDDTDRKFDDKTMALIIKELLIKPSVSDKENNQVEIHGQMIITAKNPAPYLKKALSKCTVVETATMDTVLEKLDVEDETELEDKILEDMDNFSDILLTYSVQENLAKKYKETEARKRLKSDMASNIDKDEIDNNIDIFIKAIKDKNIEYFKKVSGTEDKDGNDIYEQLRHAFNKDTGYFIGQDMYLYYNAIYEPPFATNKLLMDRLKVKDKMFRQEVKVLRILTKDGKEDVLFPVPSGGKETANKDLYRIADCKLAKDIKIPDGATVISSQGKLDKFTFTTKSEEEKCIQRSKEYRDKKKKEKEQK